jgi:hypothetical protein
VCPKADFSRAVIRAGGAFGGDIGDADLSAGLVLKANRQFGRGPVARTGQTRIDRLIGPQEHSGQIGHTDVQSDARPNTGSEPHNIQHVENAVGYVHHQFM